MSQLSPLEKKAWKMVVDSHQDRKDIAEKHSDFDIEEDLDDIHRNDVHTGRKRFNSAELLDDILHKDHPTVKEKGHYPENYQKYLKKHPDDDEPKKQKGQKEKISQNA
jgi:hypothetical protein